MSESFDIVFQGTGESECIEFIQAVQKYAKKNKKMRDNKWIADEVYGAFGRQALGWYVRLPVNLREDWELLQQALAARWIPEIDDNPGVNVSSPAIPPVAAAAPLAAYPPQPTFSKPFIPSGKVGRVRIRMTGTTKHDVRYLSKEIRKKGHPPWLGAFDTTADVALAMNVRLVMVGHNLYRLELVEHESKLLVLAAFLYYSDDWNEGDCFGTFVAVDAPGQGALRDRQTTFKANSIQKGRQFWTERWQVEDTGILTLCGPGAQEGTARFALRVNDSDSDNNFLVFTSPKASYSSSNWAQTVLEFVPLYG